MNASTRQLTQLQLGAALARAIAGLTIHERNILGLQLSGIVDRDLIGGIYRVGRQSVDAWIDELQAKLVDGTLEGLRRTLARPRDDGDGDGDRGDLAQLLGPIRAHLAALGPLRPPAASAPDPRCTRRSA